jgi:hypothetical protein
VQSHELAKQCVDALNLWGDDTEKAIITLVLPKGWKAPPKFPRRKLLDEHLRIYSLSAINVLAWLAANGLVDVASKSELKS